MPVFEYRCADCLRKFQILVGMTADSGEVRCSHCGSGLATKLVSRFSRFRSEDDRIDELADRVEARGEPDSPSEMRDLMREMGKALDEDASEEMEEMFEADMAGELEDEA